MAKDYMTNKIIWTYDFPFDEVAKKDYEEQYREINNLEYEDEVAESTIWEYAQEINEDDYDDIMCSIRFLEGRDGKKTYVVLGQLGLWNGTFAGGKIIEGIEAIFNKCFEDYNEFGYKHNLFYIKAYHHDGTNTFKIRELTKKGEEYAYKHQYDDPKTLHQRLFSDSHLSHTVSIFKKVF